MTVRGGGVGLTGRSGVTVNGWVYILQFTLYQLRNCNMNTIFGRRNDDLRRTKTWRK